MLNSRRLLFFFLFLFPSPAWATYTFVSSGSAGSTNDGVSVSVTLNTSTANLILVAVSDYEATTACTFMDGNSNSWTLRDTQSYSGSSRLRTYYTSSTTPTVGAGHSFSCGSSTSYMSIAVMAFLGVATSPADQITSMTGFGTSFTHSTITPTENNELLALATSSEDVVTAVSGGGFISPSQENVAISSGQHFAVSFTYVIQTTATGVTPSVEFSTNIPWTSDITTYKTTTVVPPTGPKKGSLLTLGVGR